MALGVFGWVYTWVYTAREDVGPVWVHVRLFVAFLGPWRQFGQTKVNKTTKESCYAPSSTKLVPLQMLESFWAN